MLGTQGNLFDLIDEMERKDRDDTKETPTPHRHKSAEDGYLNSFELVEILNEIQGEADRLMRKLDFVHEKSPYQNIHPVSICITHARNAASDLFLRAGDAAYAVDIELAENEPTGEFFVPSSEQGWE